MDVDYDAEMDEARDMFDSLLIDGLDWLGALRMVSKAMPDWPFLALSWELIGAGREMRHMGVGVL